MRILRPWAEWWKGTLEAIRTWERADNALTEAREGSTGRFKRPGVTLRFGFLNALLDICKGQRPGK